MLSWSIKSAESQTYERHSTVCWAIWNLRFRCPRPLRFWRIGSMGSCLHCSRTNLWAIEGRETANEMIGGFFRASGVGMSMRFSESMCIVQPSIYPNSKIACIHIIQSIIPVFMIIYTSGSISSSRVVCSLRISSDSLNKLLHGIDRKRGYRWTRQHTSFEKSG